MHQKSTNVYSSSSLGDIESKNAISIPNQFKISKSQRTYRINPALAFALGL